jgi:hypothetical protein
MQQLTRALEALPQGLRRSTVVIAIVVVVSAIGLQQLRDAQRAERDDHARAGEQEFAFHGVSFGCWCLCMFPPNGIP